MKQIGERGQLGNGSDEIPVGRRLVGKFWIDEDIVDRNVERRLGCAGEKNYPGP